MIPFYSVEKIKFFLIHLNLSLVTCCIACLAAKEREMRTTELKPFDNR